MPWMDGLIVVMEVVHFATYISTPHKLLDLEIVCFFLICLVMRDFYFNKPL